MISMIAYLLLLQCAALVFLVSGAERDRMNLPVLITQGMMLGMFWLAWGGYSIDAWRYWWRFGQSPFFLDTDRLFWIAGWLVQQVFGHPWSLRVMSVAGVLVFLYAIWRYFRADDRSLVVYAYMSVPVVPIFFFGFGNALRQAIAAALCLLGMAWFSDRRTGRSLAVWTAAIFVHLPVLVVLAAAVAGRLLGRISILALLLLPVFGVVLHTLIDWYGFSPELIVRYSDDSEGRFHFLKYVVHLLVVILCVGILRSRANRRDAWLIDTYCFTVAFASVFLLYEVPMERLLLYAEVFLPILAALLFARFARGTGTALVLWGILTLAGIGLWSHPSIRDTIGL